MNEKNFGFLDTNDSKMIETLEKMLEDKYNKGKEKIEKSLDNKTA